MPVSTHACPRGHPGYSENLPCTAESAETARGLVRIALAVWGLETLADDAALVVTELVANAARHTSSRLIRVAVNRLGEDTVLIAVVDKNKAPVVRRSPHEDDTTGRGLVLVDALTAHWGVTTTPWGKRVWAELKIGMPS
jgi:anti-sigma regulatory factor (Ser/Thr protein kinase)